MLNELRFVQGSVAKKDFVPSLTHFCIENGTVRGYNGVIALCSPIPFDIACKPKAAPMVAAIRNCTETVSLSLTAAGRLSIKSGKFKVNIECIETESPHVLPEGDQIAIDGKALLEAIKTIAPFVGDDASRPWSNGILIKGQSAFATNNVILVEYWTGVQFPEVVNLPRAAVKEILRINEAPEYAQCDGSSLTFHFSGGRWVRSQLLATDWPDLSKILDRKSMQVPMNPQLFEGLNVVKPFADGLGRIIFHEGALCTSTTEGEGARYELTDLTHPGSYNADMLGSLEGVALTIDFSTYPNPCIFQGNRLRGAIVGMKQL